GPGASRIDTALQDALGAGSEEAAAEAAAAVLARLGRTKLPAGFWILATVIEFWTVYASSTYPIAYCVWMTFAATPAFPGCPIPTSQLIDLPPSEVLQAPP